MHSSKIMRSIKISYLKIDTFSQESIYHFVLTLFDKKRIKIGTQITNKK